MLRYTFAFMMLFSSMAFSQEHRLSLGTQFGMHGLVPVAGAELMMPVSERLSISYAYVQGQTSLAGLVDTGVDTAITRADFALSEASVTFRWLLSRSFYAGVGAGYRTLKLDVEGRNRFDDRSAQGYIHSEALQAKALIGNSWNFSNGIYLAVDWIGIGFPLRVTQARADIVEIEAGQRTFLTEENDHDIKRATAKVSRANLATALTLRLGMNF